MNTIYLTRVLFLFVMGFHILAFCDSRSRQLGADDIRDFGVGYPRDDPSLDNNGKLVRDHARGIDGAACDEQNQCASEILVCVNNICRHKNLFPFQPVDYFGTVAVFVSGALSAGSGTGGGGLLVPLYIIVLGLFPHDAIPLSKATIFGGALANFFMNYSKRHPIHKSRLLIDYDVVMLMEPMTLAGTIIGVYLNKMFPSWLITCMLCVVLGLTSRKTYLKGLEIWNKEDAAQKAVLEQIILYWQQLTTRRCDRERYLCSKYTNKWRETIRIRKIERLKASAEMSLMNAVHVKTMEDDVYSLWDDQKEMLIKKRGLLGEGVWKLHRQPLTLEEFHREEGKFPWNTIFVLLLVWAGVIAISLLKGGHGARSLLGLECGSVKYWMMVLLSFPFLFLVTYWYACEIIKKHRIMQMIGYQYCQGDLIWDEYSATIYPPICMLAGIAAGLLGIGGGMVKGPLLLEMGFLPEVVSATSSFMILFTSSSTTAQFVIFGMLRYDYALWFAIVGFAASICGQQVIEYFTRKYHKRALIVFPLSIVIGLSGIIMVGLGVADFMINGLDGFKSICS